ncbi:hypothetical protein GCM10011491_10590 [Brucella endophytica]|uniref:AP2 domain-containing protein n=1 Tax=Brucella endophytica TaxID=1963359 RepID=A0A916S7J8_9HYPH|nr:hypothetical protein [Brucella endophytica]GGA84881.1 hypothetical protein GCM10011491_10590 [Brucella endophytica]
MSERKRELIPVDRISQQDIENFGIWREKPKKPTHGKGWRVSIQRRGLVVLRNFKDAVYGSSEAALAQARAYRNAVIDILPPMTNREHAVQLRRNNTTGVPGIYRVEKEAGVFWEAHLHLAEGTKRKLFPATKYGEWEARAMAIAQRQQWLSEWEVEYFGTVGSYTKLKAGQRLAELADDKPDVLPTEMPKAEINARLAAINACFDAMRPLRLWVSVNCASGSRGRMSIVVSDAGRPARKLQREAGLRQQTLPEVLTKARVRIEQAITELYDLGVARWFMEKHGYLLDPECFDAQTGFRVGVLLPDELAAAVN